MKQIIVTALLLMIGVAQAEGLRILAPVSAGGAMDVLARNIQNTLLSSGLASGVEVYNIAGKASTLGLADFANRQKGQANQLMVFGATTVGGVIAYKSPINLQDIRPIARLVSSPMVLLVPTNSLYRNLAELKQSVVLNPAGVRFGGGSLGSVGYMVTRMVYKDISPDNAAFKFVPSAAQGQAIKAMLQSQIDVVATEYSVADEYVRSGQARALAITTSERVEGLNIPTLREQGLAITFESWQGIAAPAGLSGEEYIRLGKLFTDMVRTPQWQAVLKKEFWENNYQGSLEFRSFIQSETSRLTYLLEDLSLND